MKNEVPGEITVVCGNNLQPDTWFSIMEYPPKNGDQFQQFHDGDDCESDQGSGEAFS